MKINTLYFFILLLGLSFASCDEEVIIDDPSTTIVDPPTEIEYPVAIGFVTGQDGALAGASVSVYQDGLLKGTTTSDDEGAYTTIDIETEEDEDLILVFEKEDYGVAYRKRSGESLKSSKLSVQLLSAESLYGPAAAIPNPNSNQFIALSGYVKDVQGNAGHGLIAVEWMEGTTFWGSTSATDDTGYFELLVGRGAELRVSIFSDTVCFDYLTVEEVSIFLGLKAEVMGPFDNDVILADYTNATGQGFEIGGEVLQCGGGQANITSAEITIQRNDGSSTVHVFDNLVDEQFSLVEEACMDLPYTISIVGKDKAYNRTTDTLVITVNDATYTNNNIQLEACHDIDTGFSTAVMTVDGVDYIFNEVVARMENGDLLSDSLTFSYSRFTIPNVMLGQNDIHELDMFSWGNSSYFKAVNDIMPCNVTDLTANSATVIVTGDFVDVNGTTVNGTCTLNLKY